MLILASASPRRRELLAQVGIDFAVLPAHIDETQQEGEAPDAYVRRLALEKAQAVYALQPEATVLGADTTVVLQGRVLNKPQDRKEAERMLRTLSGRMHEVHTGVALVSDGFVQQHTETTGVVFKTIAEDELQEYLATGDSLDKAGAYGIQGYAARWVERVEGDRNNVVGLPVAVVLRMLEQHRSK